MTTLSQHMNKKKIVILFLFIVVIGLFFAFDLGQYLNLGYIKSKQELINDFYNLNPVWTGFIFFICYVLITGTSLPGASVMTLIGGAIFGVFWGTILVSFSSVLGATIAFLLVRYLFHDFVQSRYKKQLEPINDGIKKEGGFYLFTLRLVPAFPFFIINILMALTPIKTINFALISQIGMLPATIVYVNAGTQLAKVDSLNDILTTNIIISFALIGIIPLLSKKILNYIKKRQLAN
jgi:uncharacterized membrane protein YdjX (TVP38/TMEM64 family)